MAKKLFEIYVTYGKGNGEELRESWVAEDTPENRSEYLDDLCYSDEFADSDSNFIDGKSNIMHYYCYGGDWNDPTGGWLQVRSYNDVMDELQMEYLRKSREVKKQFGYGE